MQRYKIKIFVLKKLNHKNYYQDFLLQTDAAPTLREKCLYLEFFWSIGQSLLNGYSTPFRLDRNAHGGGILLYVREDILSKLLLVEENTIEGFFVEMNL